jgi:tRNA acetyltransferase TAN1
VVHASVESITKAAKEYIKPYFEQLETLTEYAIVARVRNCAGLSRTEIIEIIAKNVQETHKVNLTNPKHCIMVEVCKVKHGSTNQKNFCGISIVTDFYKLKKFSFETMFESKNV